MALVSTEMHLRSMSPGPERFMTMNLISSGPCTVSSGFTSYGRTVRRMKTRDNHTTADVDGAQTFIRTNTLTNKPDSHNVTDIAGTASMPLHKDTNKPDRQLFHDDIDGSNPRNKWLFRTRRCVNPLDPEYTLPSFVAAPTVVPKFTRDSYDVSDIEGTKSRPLYPLVQRQNHLVDDIEGAQSGWKPKHRRARHDAAPLDYSLNVKDITGGGFRTRRATNPLTPSYRVNGMDIADDPVKSRPRTLPKARDGPFYPLTTLDIEGAQPGWRPLPQTNPPLEARRHFRNTNFMGDIPGAQADTVRHSICTDRHVNPLNPVYASLDGEPLANPQTPLYKEPACVEAEMQLDRTIAAEGSAAAAAVSSSSPAKPSRQDARTSGDESPNRVSNQQEGASPAQQRPSSEPLRSSRDQGGSWSKAGDAAGGSGRRKEGRTGVQLGKAAQSAKDSFSAENSRVSDDGSGTDERIRRLENEVRLLRKGAGEAWQRRPPSGAVTTELGRGGSSSGRTTTRSWPGLSSDRQEQQQSVLRPMNRQVEGLATGSPGPFLAPSSGNGRSRMKFPRSASAAADTFQTSRRSRSVDSRGGASSSCDGGGGGGRRRGEEKSGEGGVGAMFVRSRGGHAGQETERLVLRSASGTPRVLLTPSERRSAREYTDDVSSVRDLI